MDITLERRFFKTNSAGESEFDWLLDQIGIKDNGEQKIDTVEFELVSVNFTINDDTVTVS